MTIIKGHPVANLPPYDRDGEAASWDGVPLADDGTLPIAYTPGWFADPASILYQSPLCNAAGITPRQPCVIVGGEVDLVTGASQAIRDRLDAVGVLHVATLNELTDCVHGLPVSGLGDFRPRDPEKYTAGRLLYINGDTLNVSAYRASTGFVEAVFDDTPITDTAMLDAEPGTDAQCSLFGETEGLATIPYEVEFGPVDATYVRNDGADQWLTDIAAAAARCDRYLQMAVIDSEPTNYTATAQMSCYNGAELINNQHDNPDLPDIILGDNSLQLASLTAAVADLFADAGDIAMLRTTGPYTNDEILAQALLLFED